METTTKRAQVKIIVGTYGLEEMDEPATKTEMISYCHQLKAELALDGIDADVTLGGPTDKNEISIIDVGQFSENFIEQTYQAAAENVWDEGNFWGE